MKLSSQELPDALLITVHEKRIDASGAIKFKDQMRQFTTGGPARVVLNLEAVDFVDSSGLGAIVASRKQLEPGQVLELSTLSPTVKKVFHLTRMDTVFTIHDSRDGAAGGADRAAGRAN